jgi:hypothetical protein
MAQYRLNGKIWRGSMIVTISCDTYIVMCSGTALLSQRVGVASALISKPWENAIYHLLTVKSCTELCSPIIAFHRQGSTALPVSTRFSDGGVSIPPHIFILGNVSPDWLFEKVSGSCIMAPVDDKCLAHLLLL